jgi:hypothetical protein
MNDLIFNGAKCYVGVYSYSKNAGTTMNTILKRNFGERYTEFYTQRQGIFYPKRNL